MTEQQPIAQLEYKVISGTRSEVQDRLNEYGKERWLLNGMATCVLPGWELGDAAERGPQIIMTCVVMRTVEPVVDKPLTWSEIEQDGGPASAH